MSDPQGEKKTRPDEEKMRLATEEAKAKEEAQHVASEAKQADEAQAKAKEAAPSRPAAPSKPKAKNAGDDEAKEAEVEAVEEPYQPKAKPELDDATKAALRARAAKKAKTPLFRRHEWWRYKDLGGKDAPWRRPRGIHSKQRRHFKYRPPVVSVGYRGPTAARGLHPSGFEEVLVHRPEDLGPVDPKTQAVRIGGTVGGRKAEAIQKVADERGIRVLNRRS